MTAQIFVDILNHAFFSVHQLNLLVFDECHAAVKDAPMKQVFSKLNTFGGNIISMIQYSIFVLPEPIVCCFCWWSQSTSKNFRTDRSSV